ncbi:hypothetical protein V6N12_049120 [Hibiscus sabdariffa]|uniref:Uncharacterized protein n=1 Tax=Hibiscus sabdariffa TaxID=183260 RepID=A0ABR2ELL3_9ROSI
MTCMQKDMSSVTEEKWQMYFAREWRDSNQKPTAQQHEYMVRTMEECTQGVWVYEKGSPRVPIGSNEKIWSRDPTTKGKVDGKT